MPTPNRLATAPTLVLVAMALIALAAVTHARTRPAPKPVVPAVAPAHAADSCLAVPGPAPDVLPVVRARLGLNYTTEMLEQPSTGAVDVCLLIDTTGTVLEAGLPHPGSSLDDAAIEAARWWLFEPAKRAGRAVPARVRASVEFAVPRDADPLVPDVVALARDAERQGNLRDALDAWTGALARAGRNVSLGNEWIIREHVIRVASLMPTWPEVPAEAISRAKQMHNLMLRDMARQSNVEYAEALDKVLLTAPWYTDAYRWRASARSASGSKVGAMRDVLCYRLAVRDSAGRALAERALVALAKADTVAAMTMLKN